jgi:hypothetical protein
MTPLVSFLLNRIDGALLRDLLDVLADRCRQTARLRVRPADGRDSLTR